MHRTRIAIAVLLAAATAGTVVVTAAAMTRNTPPCTPKVTTISGHTAAVNCGPATATLRIGGRSYTFRNGFCQHSKSTGASPQLDLGTSVIGVKSNAGKADLSMLIDARLHSPLGTGSVFHAHYGGKQLLGDSLITAKGNLPAKGTFTGTTATGAKFTGAWDCHGFVWQRP